MDENQNNLYKQLANDLKILSNINSGIMFNKKYIDLVGPLTIKNLEKVENHLDRIRNEVETKYLMFSADKDIVGLYKTINKNEKIFDMINRLEKP